MSLSSSLSSAVAGLDTTSRRAEIVARNIANSERAGYARRSLETSSARLGAAGSRTVVAQAGDPRLVQLRREAQSREAGTSVIQKFHIALDSAIGDPDRPGSLQNDLARFDSALISAAGNPTAASGLALVSSTAETLAKNLNGLDRVVTEGRQRADTDIGRTVSRLNSDLADVERLNTDIRRLSSGGHDIADLRDRRSVVIDRIAVSVPVRELPREDGGVALVSDGGLLLLEGRAVELGFISRAPITSTMGNPGQLSGLTVNGREVATGGSTSGIQGGSLASLFMLRDEIAPEATDRLDAIALDLISRFERPEVDTTRGNDTPGLFTDRGSVAASIPDAGVAGRIRLNTLVAPDRLENHFRIRDGLSATAPSEWADGGLLLRYGEALSIRATPVSTGLPNVSADLGGHLAALRSILSADRVGTDDRHSVQFTIAKELGEVRDGAAVDIDGELRRLLEVEQAYAANARVIQAVNDMMTKITEL